MENDVTYEPTIQKFMYGAVIISFTMLIVSQFERYHTITKKAKVALRSIGIVIIGLCFLYLFQKSNRYFSIENPPEYKDGDCESTLNFVRWQKDRHKLERDMYLSTLVILWCASLILVPHWMDKYYTYIDYKNTETEHEDHKKNK